MNVNLRRVPRTPRDGVYTLCWQDAGLAHSVEVHGNDSSSSGICVRSGRAIPPGTSVYVEGPEGSYQGYATLRHCTSVNSHFNLGLEFSDAVPETSASASKDLDYYEFLQISPKATIVDVTHDVAPHGYAAVVRPCVPARFRGFRW